MNAIMRASGTRMGIGLRFCDVMVLGYCRFAIYGSNGEGFFRFCDVSMPE